MVEVKLAEKKKEGQEEGEGGAGEYTRIYTV